MLEEFGTDIMIRCCLCGKLIRKENAELIRVETVDSYLKKGRHPIRFELACGPKDLPHLW